ncbi:MAG: type II secretion system F family protein [Pseudomonadota bacterium]
MPDRERLQRAGLRGERGEAVYLGTQIGCLVTALVVGALVVQVSSVQKAGLPGLAAVMFAVAYAAIRVPKLLLSRRIATRRAAMRRAWPEVLDLMVIQIEAGRSAEQALRRVREDMAPRARALAEELAVTIAELDVFDRRQAYENLAQRIDIDDVRATCSALIQAYEQGSSLADAFRTLAKESRDARFLAAEKKAAQITSALPVPVAIFFLMPLILVLVAPSIIQYMKWQ